MSGNQALNINTPYVNNADTTNYSITTHGSDWYFAVCAVMTVATFAFLGLSMTKPRTQRIFHYITAAITMTAAIAYLTMGSGLGYTGITVEFLRNPEQSVREIFYVRYIDWVVTTPLLLLDLLLTAGMPLPSILFVIFVDEVMIITGLVGALISTSYKWAYFTVGCVALLYIVYVLVFEARLHAAHLGKDIGRVFLMCGSLTALLWTLYPIAWGISEGGNVVHPDSEAIFYGILDVLAKPGFGALLIFGHRNIDPARLGLHIRDYDDKTDLAVSKHSNKETVGSEGVAHNGTTTTAPATEAV